MELVLLSSPVINIVFYTIHRGEAKLRFCSPGEREMHSPCLVYIVDFYSKPESVISRLNFYDSLCPIQLHLSIIGTALLCLGELSQLGDIKDVLGV